MSNHAELAEALLSDPARAEWHNRSLWYLRDKRDLAAAQVPEWEDLRELAERIKLHTLANLRAYLEQFEQRAQARGAVVHWASDAASLNSIVASLIERRGARRVVKSKSMLTEECGLNRCLEERGIEVVDTDLGERIVQWRREPPSHIVMPAIHLRKEEVGELFHRRLATPKGVADPKRLTKAARQHMREKFLAAEVAITGVNFAIAETGGIVVCTNEGNADLGTSLAPVHIACMGIEKVTPRASDLGVFTRLLARSATGQPITAYTSHLHGPRRGGELHIVIVDNGRSRLLDDSDFSHSLACIRCGACLNTCPVYRRSGGHSYGSVIPGPIGSTLAPARDAKRHASLPYACSLCGSCSDVCPVKIPLHRQLLSWRRVLAERGLSNRKRSVARGATALLARPRLYRRLMEVARKLLRTSPRLAKWVLGSWTVVRDLPAIPRRSFISKAGRMRKSGDELNE